MSLMTTMASKAKQSLRFAHFAGGAKAAAENDPPKDDDKAKAAADEQEKKDEEAKAKAAADDDGDASAAAENPDSEDGDKEEGEDDQSEPKSKAKAKAGEDEPDEDDDKEMRGNSPAAAARRRERARCAAIFASKAAAKNPALACSLAFQTAMTRKEALVVLESSPAPASAANADRAARNPSLGTGGGASASSPQVSAQSWQVAMSKVRRS